MAGVYCPICEAEVDAVSKFCLTCGHNFLEGPGPITSTGHDLVELKEVIKARDDISMAEKFNLMAQIEEGVDPIRLGIAAPAEGDEQYDGLPFLEADPREGTQEEIEMLGGRELMVFGESPAASFAVKKAIGNTDAWKMTTDGRLDLTDAVYRESMTLGIDASKLIHEVAVGEFEDIDAEVIKEIPVIKPPTRAFCPKCGSDIHSFAMMQWRKWRDASTDVVSIQLEAAMETSIVKSNAHHIGTAEELQKEMNSMAAEIEDLKQRIDKTEPAALERKLRKTLRPTLKRELKKELREELEEKIRSDIEKEVRSGIVTGGGSTKAKAAAKKSAAKPKPPAMRQKGKQRPTKKFEGDEDEKPEWFLKEALDTIYDPHGSGKQLKRRTIVARSSEGNVRVEDVVNTYVGEGESGLSELAWTSPLTKYIIEAYDAC